MEVINFEKFLYYNKCELTISVSHVARIQKQKSNFLFTLNSIYYFGEHPENKNKTPDEVDLEKNLICKLNHEHIYVFFYDDLNKSIKFASRIEVIKKL